MRASQTARHRVKKSGFGLLSFVLIVSGLSVISIAPAQAIGTGTCESILASPVGVSSNVTASGSDCIVRLTVSSETTSGSGTWTVPVGVTQIQYLVVAGGGGGAGGQASEHGGGGGGAGGYLTGTLIVSTSTLSVSVGAAGTGGGVNARGTSGSNSSLGAGITAAGGGAGGTYFTNGPLTGGSGGGAGAGQVIAGANGTAGQGNNGGSVTKNLSNGRHGGGGGGAGGVGGSTTANATITMGAGAGGIGISNDISGSTTFYSGGGGGGGSTKDGGTGGGIGGSSVGGSGATWTGSATTNATAGSASTGSGGGGGIGTGGANASLGANGGSGVVFIKYTPIPATTLDYSLNLNTNASSSTTTTSNTLTLGSKKQVIPPNSTDNFTIETWIYLDRNTQNWQAIAVQDQGGVGYTGSNRLFFGLDSLLRFHVGTGATAVTSTSYSLDASIGTWKHVAMTLGQGASNLNIYVDGENIYTETLTRSATTTICGFTVGMGCDGNFETDASFDQMKIWSGILTQDQIKQSRFTYATAGISGTLPTLRAHYDFNYATSPISIQDKSGNNNNLTYTTGTATFDLTSRPIAPFFSIDASNTSSYSGSGSTVNDISQNEFTSSLGSVTYNSTKKSFELGAGPMSFTSTKGARADLSGGVSLQFMADIDTAASTDWDVLFDFGTDQSNNYARIQIWTSNNQKVLSYFSKNSVTSATYECRITGITSGMKMYSYLISNSGCTSSVNGASQSTTVSATSTYRAAAPSVASAWTYKVGSAISNSSSINGSLRSLVLSSGTPVINSVQLDANSGTGSMAIQHSSVAKALPSNAFAKSGNTFRIWNTSADGSGTDYANLASFPFTSSVTLYAIWSPLVTDSLKINLDASAVSSLAPGSTTWNSIAPGSALISPTAFASAPTAAISSGVSNQTLNGVKSLKFSGSSSYINYGHNTSTSNNGVAYTVETWINMSTYASSNWNIFASKWFANASRAGGGTEWHLGIHNNKLNVYTNSCSLIPYTEKTFSNSDRNTWFHVAFSVSATGLLKIYLNGKPSANTASNCGPTANTGLLILGDPSALTSVGFVGNMSRFRTYGKALTDAEMLKNFNGEAAGFGVATVSEAPTLAAPATIPTATAGTAYTLNMPAAAGGSGNYTYSDPGNKLPTGLSVNSTTGVISGTPTVAQTFSGIQITVTDTTSGLTAQSTAFNITVASGTQLALSIATQVGTGGSSLTLFTTGGSGGGTVSYVLAANQPAACSLSGANNSVLTGTFAGGVSGSCSVIATKAADAAFTSSISSAATTIFFTAYVEVIKQTTTCPAGTVPSAPTGIGVGSCIQVLSPVTTTQGDAGAAPKITGLSVATGLAGSTSVVITGTGFASVTRVQFGAKAAASITLGNNNTTITVTVPTGAKTGRVMVVSPNGTGIASQIFTVSDVDNRAPSFLAGNVNTSERNKINLAFNENLAASGIAATAFGVTVAGNSRIVSNPVISGTTVTLTISGAEVQVGQEVIFTYTQPQDSTALQDAAENRTSTIFATPVTGL
jgi:hypothetical protein